MDEEGGLPAGEPRRKSLDPSGTTLGGEDHLPFTRLKTADFSPSIWKEAAREPSKGTVMSSKKKKS